MHLRLAHASFLVNFLLHSQATTPLYKASIIKHAITNMMVRTPTATKMAGNANQDRREPLQIRDEPKTFWSRGVAHLDLATKMAVPTANATLHAKSAVS